MLWLPVQVVKVQKPPEIKATKVLRTKDLRVDLDVVMRKMASCEYVCSSLQKLWRIPTKDKHLKKL